MSTRSRIGLTNPDGSISSVYCHSDGYPGGVGTTLFESYQDPTKIHALIALGDLSSLDDEVAPPEGAEHEFEFAKRAPGVTVAYKRDRGEKDVDAVTDDDVFKFLATAKRNGAEYAYLWSGTWTVWDVEHENAPHPETGQPLEVALVTDRLTA